MFEVKSRAFVKILHIVIIKGNKIIFASSEKLCLELVEYTKLGNFTLTGIHFIEIIIHIIALSRHYVVAFNWDRCTILESKPELGFYFTKALQLNL